MIKIYHDFRNSNLLNAILVESCQNKIASFVELFLNKNANQSQTTQKKIAILWLKD